MPGKPKTGPPYDEVSDVYVVVTNPWGMHPKPRERQQVDFNRVGAWAQFVLREAGVSGARTPSIDCIYGMGTRDEIIIQFPPGTDIIPLLGEHRWANIANKWTGSPNDSRATCAFIYNWRNNGDPSNHNWSENYPDTRAEVVPAKSPYPVPSWTQPPPSVSRLVQSIPRPPPDPVPLAVSQGQTQQQPPSSKTCSQTSPPTPAPPSSVPALKDTAQVEPREGSQAPPPAPPVFRPYEPPSQHPSHAQFLDPRRAQEDDVSASVPPAIPTPGPVTQSPELKFIKKLDPYELEAEALRALKSEDEPVKLEDPEPDIDIDLKPLLEATESKPSVATFSSSFQPTRDPRRRPTASQPPVIPVYHEPREAPKGYEDEVYAFLRSVELPSEPDASRAETKLTPVSVKREYEEDGRHVFHPPHEVLPELNDVAEAYFQRVGSDRDVSQADTRSTAVSVKREYEEVGLAFSGGKRIKIEEPW